jgi:hypothetical protein
MLKVIITFEEIPAGMKVSDIKFAVQDAVFEFVGARRKVEQYVAKRYAHMEPWFQLRKLGSVQQRVELMSSARIEVVEE